MGIKISAKEGGPYPWPTTTTIECDKPTSFFCYGMIVFGEVPWPEAYSKMMKLGWKESPTGTFLCPACSGK